MALSLVVMVMVVDVATTAVSGLSFYCSSAAVTMVHFSVETTAVDVTSAVDVNLAVNKRRSDISLLLLHLLNTLLIQKK